MPELKKIRDMGAITDGEYAEFQYDVNLCINVLGKVNLNIYTDGSGNSYALDSSGNPIQNRVVIETNYIYPYTDASGNSVYGYFKITFDDGSSFSNDDANNTAFWYYLEGLEPAIIKQFT